MSKVEKGAIVQTPNGPGVVAYVRMAAPDYTQPIAVSVVLDHKRGLRGYVASMYSIRDVRLVEEARS